MRKLIVLPGLLLLAVAVPRPIAAQEVGESVVVTGCLAQEEDDEGIEFLLEHAAGELASFAEIELMPDEGVDLSAHVGHTVEVTGVVVADDDEDEEAAEAEEVEMEEEAEMAEEGDENELHVRVTGLAHVAATCGG